MPLVNLLLPDGESGPTDAVRFAVAPRTGHAVLLNVGGKRRFFVVDETFHGMTSDDAEVLFFARLRRSQSTSRAPRADPPL